jgi:hypothetical protein
VTHEPADPAASTTDAVSSAEVRHVIVRACATCGAARQLDAACAGCGNESPPLVHDLGVVTAVYRNPVRRAVWRLVRKPLADRRIRRANVRATQLQRAHEE